MTTTSFTLDGIRPSPVLLKNSFKQRLEAAKESALVGGGEGSVCNSSVVTRAMFGCAVL